MLWGSSGMKEFSKLFVFPAFKEAKQVHKIVNITTIFFTIFLSKN